MLRGVVPRVRDYANGIRHAWAQGVKEFAYSESQRLSCSEQYMRDIPPPTYSKGAKLNTSDEAVQEEINNALTALWTAEQCSIAVEQAGSYTPPEGKTQGPNLQYFQAVNLARFNDEASEWVFGEDSELGEIASQLLGVPSVRLYQDGFFRKGDTAGAQIDILNAPTNIHRDLEMAPVEADIHGTFWCPLHPLNARNTTSLFFMGGTHNRIEGIEYLYRHMTVFENMAAADEIDTVDVGPRWANLPIAVQKVMKDADTLLPSKFREDTDGFDPPGFDFGEWPTAVQRDLLDRFCAKVEEVRLGQFPFEDIGNYYNSCANGKDRLQRREAGLKKVMADFGEEAANAYRKYLSMGRRYGRFYWDQALDFGQYEVGDCTFHSGWTTHAAPPAVTNKEESYKKIPREAVTVSFIDGAARKIPKSVWYRGSAAVAEEDYISYGRWYDKVPDGEFLESDILPVMWPREGNQSGEPRGDAEL